MFPWASLASPSSTMSAPSSKVSSGNCSREIEVNNVALAIVQEVSSNIGTNALLFSLPILLFGE